MQLRSGKTYETKTVLNPKYSSKSMFKDISVVTKHIKDKGGSTTLKHIINATREGGILYNMLVYPNYVLGWSLKYKFVKKTGDLITLSV